MASLTLLIIHFNEKEKSLGQWNYLLAVVLVFLSAMMVSTVRYPSFKSLGLRSTSTFMKAIGAALFLGCLLVLRERVLYYVLPAFFTLYLVYGFVRPQPLARLAAGNRGGRRRRTGRSALNHAGPDQPFSSPRSPALSSACCSSMPVGPVNLTIINEGAQRGFQMGHAHRPRRGGDGGDLLHDCVHRLFVVLRPAAWSRASMEVFTFVFMLFLGMKFLSAKTVTAPTQLGAAASRIEKRIDEKLHPHSAFMIGFVRVLGNIGVLLFWIVAAAYFMSHEAYFTSTMGRGHRRRQGRVHRRRGAGHEHCGFAR